MLLLQAIAALGAPLAPIGTAGPGLEASVYTSSHTTALSEVGCTGDACAAARADVLTGGELVVAIAPPVALYAHGAWVQESVDAALYAAEGYALGGGVQGRLPLGPLLGVHGWLGFDHQLTGNLDRTERATAWQIDVGAALRAGAAEDGLQAWIGVGAVPWSDQSAVVLGGDLTVALAPRLPVEGIAGVQLVSDPLLGPWDDRTRLAAGVSGALGYRTGITGFVTLLR